MGFSPLFQNTRELWNEWEMRLLVLLSLFLQLTLATQVRRRKFIFRYWIHVMVWTTYLSADSIATLMLGILSSRLANIQEPKGTTNPKSQITAFWAPFLLLHLGGADTITAFVQEDNDLWLRQLARLCIQAGLACFIYFVALSGSLLSMLAVATILVGLMKYAEKILCLFLASKGHLQDSMLVLPNFAPMYPKIMEQYNLREEEGYRVEIVEFTEVLPLDASPVDSGQAFGKEEVKNLSKAYKLFKIFKPLFLGFIHKFGDLDVSRHMFMDEGMESSDAFQIVEIELGFMYDLLYTKAPLLNCAWGVIRWVVSLSVLCAVLVFFYLQDKKDYAKVDICTTFVLISVAILLEIYSLHLAIESNWVVHWRLQRIGRSAISSTLGFLQFCRNQRWSNSVPQFSFFELSVRKINNIFPKCSWLAKLDEKLVIFYISYKEFNENIKEWIFRDIRDTVKTLERNDKLNNRVASLKLEASEVLKKLNRDDLNWSVEAMEFDKSVLIWHIATELCYYRDRKKMLDRSREDLNTYRMSKLVSRYMLYLILLHPSMLPTGTGMLQYKDILVDAQMFFQGKLALLSKNRDSVLLNVIKRVKKLFKKEKQFLHTGVQSCKKGHKSRESRDVCELCHLLLQGETDLWEENLGSTKSGSVLFDACHLASQLNNGDLGDLSMKWDLIGKVWAKLLIYAACQCKGYEHCDSLSRGGGELLSHIWLLMAHLGVAEVVQTFKPHRAYTLIKN